MIAWMAAALLDMLVIIGFLVIAMGLIVVTLCGTYVTVAVVRAAFASPKGTRTP